MLSARGGQKLSPYLCAHVSGFHTSKWCVCISFKQRWSLRKINAEECSLTSIQLTLGLLELRRRGEEWRCEGLAVVLSSSMGSSVITLPSPELAARRSLVRAAGAAVCCCRPHWSGGEERKRLAGRSWSSRCFWPARPSLAGENNRSEAAPGCRLVFAAARWPVPFAASPEQLGE
ncbi:hypothetical protein KY284_021855 [Solanum tuberosum]|nr:hypothetical protein KY284_021855 [Solanum tuberosum]